jgi:hypothetical protein
MKTFLRLAVLVCAFAVLTHGQQPVSATIAAPLDGSNNVKVNCVTGCTGGNANGQATMANSAPVVIASNQSAFTVNAAQSGSWSFTCTSGCAGGNANGQATMANSAPVVIASNQSAFSVNAVQSGSWTVAVTGTFWQTTQPVSGTFWQATQPVSGTFWQTTQPVSIASMPSTPVTGTFWQTTQPVSGTFWQTTQPVSIASMPSTPVTGTFYQATQPVSNAGTFAVQSAESGTWNVNVSNSSLAVTGTFWQATQPVSGTFWQTTQPVSLAANQSVNVAQLGGSAVYVDPCLVNAPSVYIVNFATTTTTTMISGTASKQTYLCGISILPVSAAVNLNIVEGTGTNCSTISAGLIGGTTAATGPNIAANGGFVMFNGGSWVAKTATAADNVCFMASASSQVSGVIKYVQQ